MDNSNSGQSSRNGQHSQTKTLNPGAPITAATCGSEKPQKHSENPSKPTAPAIREAVASELAIFRQARVDQTVEALEGGHQLLELIPVRRPDKTTWFRTHPDKQFWFRAFLIPDERSGDLYFLSQPVWQALAKLGERAVTRKVLIPVMSRNYVLTLWPIGLGADGTLGSWAESAVRAAVTAQTEWTRIASNRELGAYEIRARPSDNIEPKWPALDILEMLRIAFRGRVITSVDHPIIRELRGEPSARDGQDLIEAVLAA